MNDTQPDERRRSFLKTAMIGAVGARLLDRQLSAISCLTSVGIAVKVNTVVIPIIPLQTTPFAAMKLPTDEELQMLRQVGEIHLPQMRHCMRCRADSVGLLTDPAARQASCSDVDAKSPITM